MVKRPPAARRSPFSVSRLQLNMKVFIPSILIIGTLVIVTAVIPETMGTVFSATLAGVVDTFGWWYILIVAACIAFTLWIGFSRFGKIRLGKDHDRPEFSRISWYAMLFSAGIGIGVLFYGTSEAVAHYTTPPRQVPEQTIEAARYGVHITWMEWGAGAFAIYVVAGLGIALATHRRGRPISIRWALEPIFGDRVKGWLGHVIDIIAIFSTVLGLATSLGLGALQLSTGLEYIDLISISGSGVVFLILGIAALAGISVISGLGRGIKWLSNINVALAGLLLLFVLLAGPTMFILEATVSQVGYYAQNILQSSFETDFSEGNAWQSYWTTFFWAWWVAWGPFVGTFLARISKGRTIKEFSLGVLVVPTTAIFLWFSVMGWSSLNREIFGSGGLADLAPEQVIFEYLSGLPLSAISSILTLVLIVTFFVTSADSGALVVATISTGGMTNPPAYTRIFWVLMIAGVASVLSIAGGLSALQTASVVGGLPFTAVMVFMAWGVIRDLRTTHPPILHQNPAVPAVPAATTQPPAEDPSLDPLDELEEIIVR